MTWNHRVLHSTKTHKEGTVEDIYAIHEVYSSDANPEMIGGPTMDPVAPVADTLDGLRWTLDKMREACEKPVLEMDETITQHKME